MFHVAEYFVSTRNWTHNPRVLPRVGFFNNLKKCMKMQLYLENVSQEPWSKKFKSIRTKVSVLIRTAGTSPMSKQPMTGPVRTGHWCRNLSDWLISHRATAGRRYLRGNSHVAFPSSSTPPRPRVHPLSRTSTLILSTPFDSTPCFTDSDIGAPPYLKYSYR